MNSLMERQTHPMIARDFWQESTLIDVPHACPTRSPRPHAANPRIIAIDHHEVEEEFERWDGLS